MPLDTPAPSSVTTPPAATAPRKAYADRDTPFIANTWYVAATSGEIGRDLLSRTLLDRRVMFYRQQDGTLSALHDRCCHRSMPLSEGYLDGDNVVCGYHGLTFDCTGTCVEVPSQKTPPANVAVRSYPVVERAPFIWFWPGDPDKADLALIPDTHCLQDDGWGSVHSATRVGCNYLRMHENLMDLTHFTYLHAKTGVGTPAYVSAPFDVERDGDRVRILRVLKSSEPPPLYDIPMQLDGRTIDRVSDSWFETPAFQIAHAQISVPDPTPGERQDYHVEVLHALTPESATSTHYFWAQARDYRQDAAEVDKFTYDALTEAFLEDVVAVEAIEKVFDTDATPDFWEMNIDADKASLLMRRIVRDLAIGEHGHA
jgi:phenylpropionate dioxygenase-like ring-hydroxylating dioxygenase large terminal subunit